MQRAHEFPDRLAVLVVGAGNEQVGVRRVAALDEQGVAGRYQLGFERVVGVDQGQIDLIENARQGRRFEFLELEALAVLGDVLDRRQDVARVLELDEPVLFEQHQRPAGVGRIVGQCDGRSLGQVGDLLELLRVGAVGFEMNSADRDEAGSLVLVEFVKIVVA